MSTGATLASLLRSRRDRLGLTQAELAERAGISERAVSDMERGLRRVVYADTARRLVQALDLSQEEAVRFEAVARGRPAANVEYVGTGAPPVPRTPLVGRADELAAATSLLLDGECRLVTLSGAGGVGKTRLALELWSSMAGKFPDGVKFVPLGDVRQPDLVLPAIAGALKASGRGDVTTGLAEHLGARRLLLILDTLEHLLDAAPALAEVVARAPTAKLLVTSRVPLNVRAERQVPISPLPPSDSVEMFLNCTRSVRPTLPIDAGDAAAVAEICRRLDGLPLAIELAAARTRMLAPTEIRDHLERRLQFLVGGPIDVPARQRSMAATIGWSYDLLPSDERRLLEQLSVFAGGCTVESARNVCEGPWDLIAVLGGLVDSNLVVPESGRAGGTRFRMLDTIREYAAGRLAARAGAATGLERRHSQFFLALAEEAEPNLRASGQQVWVERLLADRDNLRAALGWAIERGESEIALRLAAALWMFWRLTFAFSEGRAWVKQVLGMDAAGADSIRARVLWGSGWLAYQQGDYGDTARRGEELTRWARAAKDATAIRNGVTLLAQERLAMGDFGAAAELFDEALQIARDGDSPWLLATSTLNRSVAALHAGDLETARTLLTKLSRCIDRWETTDSSLASGCSLLICPSWARTLRALESSSHEAFHKRPRWATRGGLPSSWTGWPRCSPPRVIGTLLRLSRGPLMRPGTAWVQVPIPPIKGPPIAGWDPFFKPLAKLERSLLPQAAAWRSSARLPWLCEMSQPISQDTSRRAPNPGQADRA